MLDEPQPIAGNDGKFTSHFFSVPRRKLYQNRTKRGIDIVGALLLLVLCLPLMVVIAILVVIDGGPVLFGHRRVGAEGRSFMCWKFRTMVTNHERLFESMMQNESLRNEWNQNFKLRNDRRVTWVGRYLRLSSLDELPQLFNVLAGTMSLVGPGPITSDEIVHYGPIFEDYKETRPGMTGMWQVSGRNNLSYSNRVKLDSDYVRKWSILTDFMILLQTPVAVISRVGAC